MSCKRALLVGMLSAMMHMITISNMKIRYSGKISYQLSTLGWEVLYLDFINITDGLPIFHWLPFWRFFFQRKCDFVTFGEKCVKSEYKVMITSKEILDPCYHTGSVNP
jgi:hypothetical protein